MGQFTSYVPYKTSDDKVKYAIIYHGLARALALIPSPKVFRWLHWFSPSTTILCTWHGPPINCLEVLTFGVCLCFAPSGFTIRCYKLLCVWVHENSSRGGVDINLVNTGRRLCKFILIKESHFFTEEHHFLLLAPALFYQGNENISSAHLTKI